VSDPVQTEHDVPSPQHLPFEERHWATERYRALHRESVRDLTKFWEPIARDVVRWRRPFTRVLDWEPPHARWFPDGELNVAENCLDRHLSTPTRSQVAYYWEGEDGAHRTISYHQLHREVDRLSSAIAARGFTSDDFAALYLPMVPELPISMLALARLGIPFTTVFSGFSATALAERIRGLGARLLITADGGYRRGATVPLKQIADDALAGSPSVKDVVVVQRTHERVPMKEGRDQTYERFVREAPRPGPLSSFPSDHLLFLLYSSGTTGHPKAIAHGSGGYLVHVAATTRWVFDPQPGEVFWCAADIGWVTGHSYIVFGPLANGMTSLLYEGVFDHPTPDRLWEMIERYHVGTLYTSPTALRGLRRHGDAHVTSHDLSSLRLLGTVGEAINPTVWDWYFRVVGGGRCPIVDTWWQTETGGIMISPAPGLGLVPLKPGSATYPLPGIDADVVNERGESTAPGEKGYAVVRRPWPGMLLTLHGEEGRYRAAYWQRFPGAYYAGDFAVRDPDGYFWFLGRADEVLKVAGHRLGTIEIEDAILSFPGVAEAAVCGRADEVKGEVPVAFVVVKEGEAHDPELGRAVAAHVAARIGKLARPEEVYFVSKLPKTRSGKIMRRVVKAVADGRADLGDTTTLEDGASVDEIREAMARLRDELRR
jgi:acetyl-CoA synthetase